MEELLARFVRRYARRTTVNGVVMMVTDDDPLLVEAFRQLGWSDPQPEAVHVATDEHAVMREPERR